MRPNKPERLVGTDFAATALLSISRPRTAKGRDSGEVAFPCYIKRKRPEKEYLSGLL
jgi:hypothetical protein